VAGAAEAGGKRDGSDKRLRVFISYSRRDAEIADRIVSLLERHEFDVAIDRRDLPYGEEWQKELGALIAHSDTVIWLVSPDSVASKWCNWELGELQRLSKRLIPVRVRDVPPEALPQSLGRIHLLPAEGVFSEVHEAELVRTLNTDRAWLREATALAEDAAQWLDGGRDSGMLLRGARLTAAEIWATKAPRSAPAPASEILDLILSSRRSQRRRQVYALAGSLVAAVIALALAATAFLFQQRASQAATAAEQDAARLSVSVSNTLVEDGRTSEAALLLLDASKSFTPETVEDQMLIGFHRLNEATSAIRRRYAIDADAMALDHGGYLYLVYRDGSQVLRIDGKNEPVSLLSENARASPVKAADFIGNGDLVLIREDLSVDRLTPGSKALVTVGALSPPPEKPGRVFNRDTPESFEFHASGMIETRSSFLDTDGGGGDFGRLYDALSGAEATSDESGLDYLRSINGKEYLIDSGKPFEITRLQGKFELADVEIADADYGRLVTSTCLLDSGMPREKLTSEFLATALKNESLEYQSNFYNYACVHTEKGNVVYSYRSLGASGYSDVFGVLSTEGIAEALELTDGLAGRVDLTWWGVDYRTGDVAAIQGRDLVVYSTEYGVSRKSHTRMETAGASGAPMPDNAVAVWDQNNREVVIVASVRPTARPSILTEGWTGKLRRHNAGNCEWIQPEHFEAAPTVAGDVGIESVSAETADGKTETRMYLTIAGDRREIDVGGLKTAGCFQLSHDGSLLLGNGKKVETFDVRKVFETRRLEGAKVDELPDANIGSAFFIGADNDIVTTDGGLTVSRWRKDASGHWNKNLIYEGSLEVRYAEPDRTGGRLLIIEQVDQTVPGSFLYSLQAGQRWVELGSNYRWYGASLVGDGDAAVWTIDRQFTVQLPTFQALLAEAAAGLAPRCRPIVVGEPRSSPCWPNRL